MNYQDNVIGGLPNIQIPESEIPQQYKDKCAKGDLGGVFVVFLNAKNTAELAEKTEKLKKFCKRLEKQYDVK